MPFTSSFPFNLFHRIMKIDLRSLTMLIMFMATVWFILNDVHSTPFDFHSHFPQFIRSWITNRREREKRIKFILVHQVRHNVNESKWFLLRIDKYLLKIYHFFLTVYRIHYSLCTWYGRGHEKLPDTEYHQWQEAAVEEAAKMIN